MQAGPFAEHLAQFNFAQTLTKFLDDHQDDVSQRFSPTIRVRVHTSISLWSIKTYSIQIQLFRTIEVHYISLETWEVERNLLRCSSSFQNRPRYDAVLIQTDSSTPLFARLLTIFTIRDGRDDKGVALALVLPYNASVTPSQRRKDRTLGFYRIKQNPRVVPELVFARSIIRGTVLSPANDSNTEYFVFDVLDADMFLRVQDYLGSL